MQQVAELQKENFGLKLRIYFLENRSKIPLGDNEENLSEMVCVRQRRVVNENYNANMLNMDLEKLCLIQWLSGSNNSHTAWAAEVRNVNPVSCCALLVYAG